MKNSSTSTVGSVREFYNGFASNYEKQRTSKAFMRLISNLDRGVVFNGVIDGTVLEVGPGSGRITERLIERGLDVSVCDLSDGMLELIAERFPDVPRHETELNQLARLKSYGSFDNAVACRVLPHVPQLEGAISALAGTVRPGGRVIFDLWNKWGYVGLSRRLGVKRSKVYTSFQSITEMRRLIHSAGLRVLRERGMAFAPIPPYPLELFGNTRLRSVAHIVMFVCERESGV